jgi:hypothetical protein
MCPCVLNITNLAPVSGFLAETFEGRRAEKIEIYTEILRGSSDRETVYRGGCRRRHADDDEDAQEET